MRLTPYILALAVFLVLNGNVVTPIDVGEIRCINSVFYFNKPCIVYRDGLSSITLDDANSYLIQPGYPLLPCDVEVFRLPFGSRVYSIDVEVSDVYEESLSGIVEPSPTPYQLGLKTNGYRGLNYSFIIYPREWFSYRLGSGIYRGERTVFVNIELYPVRYNLVENKVIVARSMSITIKYTTIPSAPIDKEYQLLVISPGEFAGDIQPLVDHKIKRNISTKLVLLDEIYNGVYFPVEGGDDAEKIKYFIRNAVENWGTTFVLLVGGIEWIPSRETHIVVSSSDQEVFVSDLYYADIYNASGGFSSWDTNNNSVFAEYNWFNHSDELDLYPDVYLGRLACVNRDEVRGVVGKIIEYEDNKAYTQDWFTRLIVVGGDSFPDDSSGINEGEFVNEAVIKIMDGFIPDKIWDSNGRLSGYSPSGVSEITTAFEKGAGFVDFSGHGAPSVYATHRHNSSVWIPTPTGGLYSYQVLDFHNHGMYPIVITGACSVGKYSEDYECFSWSFVSNPYGGGIASMGATALGYAYVGRYVTYGLIEGMTTSMFKAYKRGALTFGEIWVDGLNLYLRRHLTAGDYKTILEWQPFGDPSLAVSEKSNPPGKPLVWGPTRCRVGVEYTFNATSTDPDGDKVYYMFDWGDGSYSGWLGPYRSNETVIVSHIWDKRGGYQVRVKVKDEHGVLGPWSDPIPVSVSWRLSDFISRAIGGTIHHSSIHLSSLMRNLFYQLH